MHDDPADSPELPEDLDAALGPEQLLELEPWVWSTVLHPDTGALERPPPEHLEAVRALVAHSDLWVAYRAAILLSAWGEDEGLRFWLAFLAGAGEREEVMLAHRVGEVEDYDKIAEFAFLHGRAGGDRELELAVYRELLAMVGGELAVDLSHHLPLILDVAAYAPPVLREQLADIVREGLARRDGELLCFMPVLALVDPDSTLQLCELIFASFGPAQMSSSTPELAEALARLCTPAATQRVQSLCESESDHLRALGSSTLDCICQRDNERNWRWWWQRKGATPLAFLYPLIVAPSGPLALALRDFLWGPDDALTQSRRDYLSGESLDEPAWDPEPLRELLGGELELPTRRDELLFVALVRALLGQDEAWTSLDAFVDKRLGETQAEPGLPDWEDDDDLALGAVARVAFIRSIRAEDRTHFEALAKRLLAAATTHGVSIELAAALRDSAGGGALTSELLEAYTQLLDIDGDYAASLLLPAIARHAPAEARPLIEAALLTEDTIYDTALFATIALAELDDPETTAWLRELLEHPNYRVRMEAKAALEGRARRAQRLLGEPLRQQD